MKRLLLVAALLLLPSALFAQAPDRDMLLTPDGTLYTIESDNSENHPESKLDATTFLTLTIQQGNSITKTLVPESASAGMHIRPALAYDSDSKTLFAFWLHIPNSMSGELLFAAYSYGRWQPASSTIIPGDPYHFRFNLRIGVTHRISQLQNDGTYYDVYGTVVHAVWWEEAGLGTKARYAMIAIERGVVSYVEVYDLDQFDGTADKAADVDPSFNAEILKHPAIIESTNSVDVIYGDTDSRTFKRVTLKPVADARIHIPIGHHDGGGTRIRTIPAPASFSAKWTGRITTITGSDDKFVLYNVQSDSVSYVMYANGAWSDVKSIAISDKVSPDAAVAALNKMALSQ